MPARLSCQICPGCDGPKYRYSEMCRTCRVSSRRDLVTFPPSREPTPFEVAWVAGFYEGEGTCGCYGKTGGFNVKLYQMKTDWPLVKAREFVGGNLYLRIDGCWVLELSGKLGEDFLSLVWSYLSPERKAQADTAREYLRTRREGLVFAVAQRREARAREGDPVVVTLDELLEGGVA